MYMYLYVHNNYNTHRVYCVTMIIIVLFLPSDWVWNGKNFIQVSKEWKMVSTPPHDYVHALYHSYCNHTYYTAKP